MVRWGILGPGKISHWFAKAVSVVDSAHLAAVGSRDAGRAQTFASRYDIGDAYDSYDQLAAARSVDAVYIATPHRFHFENAMMCLESGKHVLCEKPLTVNADQARELVRKSRQTGLFLMEAVWTRFLPVYGVIRTWLDDRAIGDIRFLSSTFSFRTDRDEAGRLLNHELAGGALLDLGIYNVFASRWVLGTNPSKITAVGIIGSTDVDEMVSASMVFDGPDGQPAHSQFTCGLVSAAENAFHILGSHGRIRIQPPFWGATRATLITPAGEVEEEYPFRENGFEYQIEEANRCIAEEITESPLLPHSDSIANMETLDRIRSEIGLRYSFE